jgi:hypothetical protein
LPPFWQTPTVEEWEMMQSFRAKIYIFCLPSELKGHLWLSVTPVEFGLVDKTGYLFSPA